MNKYYLFYNLILSHLQIISISSYKLLFVIIFSKTCDFWKPSSFRDSVLSHSLLLWISHSRANALLSFKPIKIFNCPMWCFYFQEIAEQKRLITNQTNQLLELERMRQIIFDITGGKKTWNYFSFIYYFRYYCETYVKEPHLIKCEFTLYPTSPSN